MLPPNIRKQVIDTLVNSELNWLRQNMYNDVVAENIFRNGFKGYAAFTDDQLIANLKAKAVTGQAWECQTMLNNIADFIILGAL